MKKIFIFLFMLASLTLSLFANVQIVKVDKIYGKSTREGIFICAHTNRYFDEYSAKRLKPYLMLKPRVDFSVKVEYKEICVGNLEPAKEYTLFISKDIPLGANILLDKDYSKKVKTPDYAPDFSFKESGYILPKEADISIPIETININELSVSLYRINSNNLIDAINRYGFVKALEYYDLNEIEQEKGYKLWQKKITLNNKRNVKKTWAIDVGKYLQKRESGVYILAVTSFNKDGTVNIYDTQTQWFMISDIGLFSLKDDAGLHIYTKHLSNATPYNDVKLALVAKNNEVLGEQITKDGKAMFDIALLNGEGGLKAQAVYAYGKDNDFSVLNLSRPAYDLSDRGVRGREPPKDYNAFIYSNRDIFRASESVPFNIIVKKANGKGVENLKLSVKLIDSQSKEIAKKLITTDEYGFANAEFKLSKSAKMGRYKVAVYASSKDSIGVFRFLVEDFVPPKIEIDITKKPEIITPKQEAILKAQVRYLTKEPLTKADVEIQRVIHKAKVPFKDYKDYYFGAVDESFENEYLEPIQIKSDNDGNISVDISSKEQFDTNLPLSMFTTIIATEPAGRAVENSFNIFYANKSDYIGIKPNFEDNYIATNSKPSFDIVYLKNQKPTAGNLRYRLIEEEADYSWVYSNDSWEYNVDYSDLRVVSEGLLEAAGVTNLELNKLNWGSYRLEVFNSNTKSSYRFSSGYWGDGGKHTPDKLPISINKTEFSPDDTLKVNIKSKFSGPVLINIANYHIFKTKTVDAKENEDIEVEFKVDSSWGSSVYVLATAFRAQSKTMGATRAIGVAPFSIKDKNKILDIALKYPEKIESKSKLKVEVSSNAAKDKEVFFTISAVDKGVLNITKYKLPDPIKHFFAQLKLGVEVRDIYGDLIKAQGEHAIYSEGAGDEFEEDELKDNNTQNREKVVAFMSQKLALKSGKADVEIDIPDYQGALKLHAVAWSKDGFGSASAEVIVKDPVSMQLFMPRFLSQEDSAKIMLRGSFDKDAPKGEYLFKIKSNNLDIAPNKIAFNNENNSSTFIKEVNIKANLADEANITIEAYKDNKLIASRDYSLPIKYPLPKIFTREFMSLNPSQTLNVKDIVNRANTNKFIDGSLWVSSAPLIAVDMLKQELDNYPLRCAEQTTSRAFALLDSNSSYDKAQVVDAIDRVVSLQKLNGGFGLWSSVEDSLWISSYVMDFLTRAKDAGYSVPENSLKEGLKYLENSLNRWASTRELQEANIYALYVLARAKKIFMSDIMHFVNDTQSKVKSAISWGQLGATLKIVAEDALAKELFSKAKKSLNSGDYFVNYGGVLRDKAALVVLLNEAGFKEDATKMLIDLKLSLKDKEYLSTQELSQILRAAQAVKIKGDKIELKVGNKVYSSNKPYHIKSKNLADFKEITNIGNGSIWWDFGYIAILSKQSFEQLENRGFSITKQIFTLDGKVVDISNIAQGDRFAVVVSGTVEDGSIKDPTIIDFLPAGFEIENPNISGIDNTTSLKWLKNTTLAKYKEYRDDRFVAQFNPVKSFKFAYIVRAVTIGEFAIAPAKIEDMFKPRYRAFSKLFDKKLTIKKRSEITQNEQDEDNNTTNSNSSELTSEDYIKAATTPLGDLSKYDVYELNYLRNGIFAYVGLDFSKTNPALFDRFSKFSWYKPTIQSGAVAYSKLNALQKENVQKLLAEEKKRLGGLVLADFYRVNIRELDKKFLQRYTKEQLRILRNSLIARYGYKFNDKKLAKIFSQFSWYKVDENASSSEIIDKKMNQLQRANLMKILEVEKLKK